MPSDAVLRMVRRWEDEGNEPHGVVVLRHGVVVAEGAWQPWPRDGIRLAYSVSKTFLACAVALAEAEGLLARDERLVDVFPEAAAAAGPAGRAPHRRALPADVDRPPRRHPRHRARPRRRRRGVGGALPAPPSPRRSPGRGSCTTTARAGCWRWRCSDAPAAAARLPEATPARPDRRRARPEWTTWAGTDLGFSGLHVSTDAIARLGLLLLHDGIWQGRQVLPAGWVATASSALADTSHHPDPADWKVGYGYQMWRSRHGFRADGAYGQFALVLPDHDLVVAVTSCTETTHEVLEAVWGGAAPAPRRRCAAGRIPAAQERLRSALEQAAAPPASLHRPAARRRRAVGLHPRAHLRAPGPALGRGAPRPTAAGRSTSTTESRCASPAATDTGRMPVARPGSRAAAGLRPACSRRRSSPTRHRTRCCCGAPQGTVTARWRGVPLHGPGLAWLRAPRD